MADRYLNFAELSAHEEENHDYEILSRLNQSKFAIMAIHGGYIEHATQRLANTIAGDEHNYYCFSGIEDKCQRLHITSNHFDEPQALNIASKVETVISIHGAFGQKLKTYFGGRDEELKEKLMTALNSNGFDAEPDPSPTRQGRGKTNICNRGKSGKGVQIELPQGMRKSLFHEPDYSNPNWRENDRFYQYTDVIRNVLQKMN